MDTPPTTDSSDTSAAPLYGLAGIDLIINERLRQVYDLGFDAKHDLQYEVKDFVKAAQCYAAVAGNLLEGYMVDTNKHPPCSWPWKKEEWHPMPTVEANLIKSGALMAAALDTMKYRAK
jgi:hypothetical protein